MLIDQLKELHGDLSYKVLTKQSNTFLYTSSDYIKLQKINKFIQLIDSKEISKQQEDLIETLINLNNIPRTTYPKFINV